MLFTKLDKILKNVQKPARYIGGELGSITKTGAEIRFALAFPDMYEIAMSHLGTKILYGLLNGREDTWCERVFAPDIDMEAEMRKNGIPLYGLESLEPVKNFDIIGFTLQYEMSYTAILNMLNLAGIELLGKDRESLSPLIIAGGPCACNPEPIADFLDIVILGEGEEITLELLDLYKTAKAEKQSKEEFLINAAKLRGVYVPSLYNIEYGEFGKITAISSDKAPAKAKKSVVKDFDKSYFPDKFVIPFLDVVHDRAMLEVLRGCIRGCRFCQAGFIYRPFRERSAEVLEKQAKSLIETSGYDEISLTSLSTSDHSKLEPLLDSLLSWSCAEKVNLSLPSLRIDNFSESLIEKITKVRKSGLTFAPEAGTQRLRDVINKNITEEEIITTCRDAFKNGYTSVKLYFMLGLPTETMEDIKGIADTAQKVVDEFYSMKDRPKGKSVNVSISTACFIPKPFTPFQYEAQDSLETFLKKQQYLKECITTRKISYKYHSGQTSVIEAVLARGDRRLAPVIKQVWENGGNLESWDEHFDIERWTSAFEAAGLDPAFYIRARDYGEIMPWSHLDYGVSEEYLVRENKKAHEAKTTRNCKEQCGVCGAAGLYGEGEAVLPCKQ